MECLIPFQWRLEKVLSPDANMEVFWPMFGFLQLCCRIFYYVMLVLSISPSVKLERLFQKLFGNMSYPTHNQCRLV